MLVAFVLAAALAGATEPQSPTPSTTTPVPAAKTEPKKPELICRTEELVGSRFKKKVCMTADEWKLEEIHQDRTVRLRRGTIEVGSGL